MPASLFCASNFQVSCGGQPGLRVEQRGGQAGTAQRQQGPRQDVQDMAGRRRGKLTQAPNSSPTNRVTWRPGKAPCAVSQRRQPLAPRPPAPRPHLHDDHVAAQLVRRFEGEVGVVDALVHLQGGQRVLARGGDGQGALHAACGGGGRAAGHKPSVAAGQEQLCSAHGSLRLLGASCWQQLPDRRRTIPARHRPAASLTAQLPLG